MMKSVHILATTLATTLALGAVTHSTAAQERWSVEGRLGATLPTSDLGDTHTAGLAVGADLMYTLNTNFTVYGGVGHHRFGCDGCEADISTTGLDAGVKLLFGGNEDAMPWVRAGLLFHQPDVEGVEGDWNVGLDSGVGIDWRVSDALTLVPALRYDTYDDDGTLSWFTIDLGAHLHLGG